MEFQLNEEQHLIQQTARDFAQKELAPRAQHHDQTAEFTADQVRRLGELGFLGMQVPDLGKAVANFGKLGFHVWQGGAWDNVGQPNSGQYD